MNERKPGAEPFLSRWSRRKLEAARTPVESRPPAPVTTPADAAAAPPPAAASVPASAADALPPVESLTFDSDFSAFLKPGVEPSLQRAALRKLLRDPRFNVMDGLDTYIDDYTKASPLDPSVIKDMVSARYLFSPPATRVTAEGIVEDVPEAPAEPAAIATPPALPEASEADAPPIDALSTAEQPLPAAVAVAAATPTPTPTDKTAS
jgi:hypothetical protein